MSDADALNLLQRISPNLAGSVTFTREEAAELKLWGQGKIFQTRSLHKEIERLKDELHAARGECGEYPLPLTGA